MAVFAAPGAKYRHPGRFHRRTAAVIGCINSGAAPFYGVGKLPPAGFQRNGVYTAKRQRFSRSWTAAAMSSSVPKPERSSPDPISSAISARMISVRLTFVLVFDLISRHRRARLTSWTAFRCF